ncbi:hypothetical protein ACFPLB_13260 [Aquamicrobium segne]|uniref:Uncharacterized protein n=1 Tax=Aquamicrobium segne TaxID=469547 RepID=A0ABW0H0T7_9HYPH
MSGVLAVLARFAVVLIGYGAACLAASAFSHVLFLGWSGLAEEEAYPIFATGAMISVPLLALFMAHFNFWPSVAAIIIAEFTGKRDWLFYALAGGFVALAFAGLFYRGAEGAAETHDMALLLAMVGSGVVGGLAYWLVAGMWTPDWRK